MLTISPNLAIDESELDEHFVRASGPGGQNVNKLSSAVQLRFDLATSASLPPEVKQRAARLAGRRLTRDGVLVIIAQRFRSQERNRADARERLLALLRHAADPQPIRRATKMPAAARRRRLADKKKRGERKAGRGTPAMDGD
ncbi:MAG: ribosome-associated protein [Methylobacteriaceae bacterium]|jgi:ribosome-associated protein|nr:ribosome-associated protein [Methylobacteriaceae bacterium]